MHLHRVPPCEQIPFAQSADPWFPQNHKTDLRALKEVLEVNCSSYFVREFFLKESV